MKMKHENHTRTIENLLRMSHENVEPKFWLLISHSHYNAGGTIKPASAGTIKPASAAGNYIYIYIHFRKIALL